MKIYDDINTVLSKKSINTVTGNIYDLIQIWKSWYMGNVADFHYYSIKLANGTTKQQERKTMNMTKKLCEDYAKLLWTDKVKINLPTKKLNDRVWSILDDKLNNFSIMFPDTIEKAFAFGTGALVEYIVNEQIRIDYIPAEQIIPYQYQNGNITGMIVLSQWVEGIGSKKKYYTHLTFHEYNETKYIKYNELYVSKDQSKLGKELPFEEYFPNVELYQEYETSTPHFQIIKPRISNNFDISCPMGISIYANHIDKLKAIDLKYDSLTNEFELGKKRILVDKSAIKPTISIDPTTETETMISYFDSNDTVYQAISGMENQPVKDIDFKLRVQDHIQAIDKELGYLSAGAGLGQDFYSFDGSQVKTATEVVSDNSDTFRSKQHHELIIRDVIYDLIKAILYLDGMPEDKVSKLQIEIVFDDSIIQDKEAELKKGLELFMNKLISKEKFMRDYLGYTEDQIEEELLKIQEENKIILPEGLDFFGTDTEEETEEEDDVK